MLRTRSASEIGSGTAVSTGETGRFTAQIVRLAPQALGFGPGWGAPAAVDYFAFGRP
jgi:hypothetical protein